MKRSWWCRFFETAEFRRQRVPPWRSIARVALSTSPPPTHATTLRQASLNPEGITKISLKSSQDFVCTNLFCERVGGSCSCKLARWLEQAQPRLTNLAELNVDDNGLTSLPWPALARLPKLIVVSARNNDLDPGFVGLGTSRGTLVRRC